MRIHRASCHKYHEQFQIKNNNAVSGTPKDWWVRVEWCGHSGKDTWEVERSLVRQGCEIAIKEFWDGSNLNRSTDFNADPDNVWRCWTCERSYKSDRTLNAHITRSNPARNYHDSTADRDTRNRMHKEAQELKCHVVCDVNQTENVWMFKYLGS